MRTCDNCSLCCKLVGVDRFKKKMGEWCTYANTKKGRCTIYDTRPDECKKYNCAWLDGNVPLDLSPLKTKCVVVMRDDEEGKHVIRVIEDVEGNAVKYFSDYLQRCIQAGLGVQVFTRDKLVFQHKAAR